MIFLFLFFGDNQTCDFNARIGYSHTYEYIVNKINGINIYTVTCCFASFGENIEMWTCGNIEEDVVLFLT